MIEWTVNTLKEYFEQRFADKEVALQLQAAEYERRLSGLNNTYERIAQMQRTYLTQDKYDISVSNAQQKFDLLAIDIDGLKVRVSSIESRGLGISTTYSRILGVIGILSGVIGVVYGIFH